MKRLSSHFNPAKRLLKPFLICTNTDGNTDGNDLWSGKDEILHTAALLYRRKLSCIVGYYLQCMQTNTVLNWTSDVCEQLNGLFVCWEFSSLTLRFNFFSRLGVIETEGSKHLKSRQSCILTPARIKASRKLIHYFPSTSELSPRWNTTLTAWLCVPLRTVREATTSDATVKKIKMEEADKGFFMEQVGPLNHWTVARLN